MKNLVGLVILFVAVSCTQEAGEMQFWKVEDVTKTEERIAVLMEDAPGIINIYVKGEADGTFQVLANGQAGSKKFEFQAGKIDTVVSDYWKSPTCKTMYIPKSIKDGNLEISTLIYPKE